MKILVIDDTQTERDAAAQQLQGHEVTFAAKFTDGRDLIRQGGWDVVLTDLMMPGQREGQGDDGAEFVGQLTPYGLVLAPLALKHGMAKVAIVSSGNHHNHPVFWACDALQGSDRQDLGARSQVIPGLWAFTGYNCLTTKEKPYTKDWGKVLELITK